MSTHEEAEHSNQLGESVAEGASAEDPRGESAMMEESSAAIHEGEGSAMDHSQMQEHSGTRSYMEEGSQMQEGEGNTGSMQEGEGGEIPEEEGEGGEYGQEGDDDEDPEEESQEMRLRVQEMNEEMNDPYIKIRKNLYSKINFMRSINNVGRLYEDMMLHPVARDYSEYLSDEYNHHDKDRLEILANEYRNLGEFELIWSRWRLDDWDPLTEEMALKIFDELVDVSIESEFDKQVLLDPKMNTMALGICKSENYLVMVILISVKMLTIEKVGESDKQEIEIRGKMLNPEFGPFCCQIHFMENGNKYGQIISFENISYTPDTQDFSIIFAENSSVWQPPKYFEIYLKENPAMIPYLKRDKKLSRIPLGQLAKGIRWPLSIYSQNLRMNEDENDRSKRELELQARKKNQDLMKRKRDEEIQDKKMDREQLKAENKMRRQQGEDVDDLEEEGSEKGSAGKLEEEEEKKLNLNLEENEASENGSMSDSMSQERSNRDAKEQSISNKEIRLELEAAISEAKRELDTLQTENLSLQAKIIELRKDNPNISDKQSDVTMSDIKYANTLAHVHQIRMDLKQTQDRYKTMADNLQKKLEEKTQKCNEIKLAFMELKREVCKKAAFARSGKPIPEKLILEWEDREYAKSKELQLLRLEILKFRNTQAKLQKSMKKKEEFINGLHLIDYEQLKIENQSLNEKIEDRNEELHKLKRKNTQTVQILTHIKEKLQFEQKENDALEENAKRLLEINKNKKRIIKHLKEKKSFYEADVKSLKQETGIINSKNLTNDFMNREKNINYLYEKRMELNFHLEKMLELVRKYEKVKSQLESSKAH